MGMALMEVRYRGLSDYRVLSADQLDYDHGIKVGEHRSVPRGVADRINRDLSGVDVNPNKDLVWGPHNGWKLVLDVDEDMERVLRAEGHFTLSKVSDDGETEVVAEARTSADNPSEVIANVDDKAEQRSKVEPKDVPGSGETVGSPGPASSTGRNKGTTTGGSTRTS
jgi:hypothetical protein